MNYSHYPSIELCNKLTEIGFPEGDFFREPTSMKIVSIDLIDHICGGITDGFYRCPSVMEILDNINLGSSYELIIKKLYDYDEGYCYNVEFKYIEGCTMKSFKGNLPDSLCNMYIWLFKNRYIL